MLGSAKCIGRVGALAVALGIGVAVTTTPGVAWADDASSDSSSDPSAPSAVSASESAGSTDASSRGLDAAADVSTAGDATADVPDSVSASDVSGVTTIPDGDSASETVSGPGGELEAADDQQPAADILAEEPVTLEVAPALAAGSSSSGELQPLPAASAASAPVEAQTGSRPALAPDVDADPPTVITVPVGGDLSVTSVPTVTSLSPLAASESAGAVSVETSAVVPNNAFQASAVSVNQAARLAAPATFVNVAAGLATAALAPLLAPVAPAVPAQGPGLWVLLAWVRRQIQHTLFNRTPTIAYNPAETIQTVDGVIIGDLRAVDPDGDPLTFIVTDAPEHGSVVVNRDGTFTYTPDADFTRFGTDTFAITVDDGATYRLPGLAGVIQRGLHWGARILGLSGPDTVDAHPTVKVKARVTDTITVGDSPGQLAVSPNGTSAYVPNQGDDSVSVIDTATNTVTTTITVGDGPLWVAISPDGATAYVTHPGGLPDDPSGHTVSVIDTATNTVTTTVPVGDHPIAVAVSADGTRAYVSLMGEDTVSVIDTASNTVVDSITVGDSPGGLAISPDGATLYVANGNGHTVSVIDTATNAVTATITVGDFLAGVAVSPDGGTVYVTNTSDGAVSVIDTAIPAVIDTIVVGGNPSIVAVSPDGATVYVTNSADDTLSVIKTATNTVIATVTVGDAPRGLVVSPDGTRAYLSNMGDDTVSVISLGT